MSLNYSSEQYKVQITSGENAEYKFLLCTVLATVLYCMALKLSWGIYFLERVGVLLLDITSKNYFRDIFLPDKLPDIAEIDSITSHLQQSIILNQ